MRSVAVSKGVGLHYVINLTNGSIAKWKIENDCSGSICTLATSLQTTEAAVTNYVAFYRANNGKAIVLPNTGTYPDSAYESVRFPQLAANAGT